MSNKQYSSANSATDKRCLIVEDNEFDRAHMRRVLAAVGIPFDTYHAASVQEGMFMAVQAEFDLFLVDFNLGDGDAVELYRDIREMAPNNRDTPVIVVSSMMTEDIAARLDAEGVTVCLSKDDLTPECVETAVNRLL